MFRITVYVEHTNRLRCKSDSVIIETFYSFSSVEGAMNGLAVFCSNLDYRKAFLPIRAYISCFSFQIFKQISKGYHFVCPELSIKIGYMIVATIIDTFNNFFLRAIA